MGQELGMELVRIDYMEELDYIVEEDYKQVDYKVVDSYLEEDYYNMLGEHRVVVDYKVEVHNLEEGY
jgi:hypothetical protein